MITKKYTVAWSFWLKHVKTVEQVARTFSRKTGLDQQEIRQNLFVRLVESHNRYDSNKSAPNTWAYWQCRAVVTDLLRNSRGDFACAETVTLQSHRWSAPQIEASVYVGQIVSIANDAETKAIMARFEGLSEKEISAQLECAPYTIRRRLARLAARLED